MLSQGGHISRLLADDLGRRVLYDARAVRPGLRFRPDKIFCCLAHSPDAGITLARRTKELDHFGREYRRIQQEPALIKNRDAPSAGLACCPLRGGVSN